jgi:hypothetical protein
MTGRPRWLVWSAIAVAALAVFALVLHIVIPSAEEELESLLTELRAEGYALSPTELVGPEPPTADNGAPLLDAAVAKMTKIAGDRKGWTAPGPWKDDFDARKFVSDPDATREAREFLARLAPAMADIDEASRRAVLRWPVEDALDAPVPSVPTLQHVQQVLSVRQLAAEWPDDAIEATRVALSIGRKVRATRLIEAFLAAAGRRAAVDGLRVKIEQRAIPAGPARAALDSELREECALSVELCARLEIAVWASAFESLYRDDDRSSDAAGSAPIADGLAEFRSPWVRYRSGTPCDVLRLLRDLSRVPAQPPADCLRSVQRLRDESRPIAEVFAVAGEAAAKQRPLLDAKLRLARVALAATERSETSDVWPASLGQLSDMFPDGIPLDPFTGRPFLYERDGRAVRIASAGRSDDEPAISESELVERGLVWTIKR